MKIITIELLKSWNAREEELEEFSELLPNGGTLPECMEMLDANNYRSWADWLFNQCKKSADFFQETKDGSRNSGRRNSGSHNSGDQNSGDQNLGHSNSGHRNSGSHNSGDQNSGDQNSGHLNSGSQNSGGWNSGDLNTGYFNTITPEEILIFNKSCKKKLWENSEKPGFIFFCLTQWINEEEMTDMEKIDNPSFFVSGGYLKKIDYKKAWKNSWDKASTKDKELLLKLPNFDAEVFNEISGIDVNKD